MNVLSTSDFQPAQLLSFLIRIHCMDDSVDPDKLASRENYFFTNDIWGDPSQEIY